MAPLLSLIRTVGLGMGLISSAAFAATFSVGPGAGCTHTTIAAAISQAQTNGPDLDEIRITSGLYSAQALQIADQSLRVRGGYANCTEASATGSATLLSGSGNGNQAVLTISTPGATRRQLSLQNLTITQGRGGVRAIGNMQLELAGVVLTTNNATNGGGLYVKGDGASTGANVSLGAFQMMRTRIENNAATQGGGVYVDDFAFLPLADASISGNSANFGGGVFASGSNAEVKIVGYPSSSVETGIRNNSAAMDGGGVYLQSGADFGSSRFSDESPTPTIANNSAGRNGGGIYASSDGNFVLGYNLALQGNTAGVSQNGNGGGLYIAANSGALLDDGGDSTTCGRPDPCVAIENNRAGINGFIGSGGGIYLLGSANISAVRARIAGNIAQTGAAVYAIGAGSAARLTSALVENNSGAGHSFRIEAGATLELRGVTLGNDSAAQGMIALSGGNALIDTSLIYDPGANILTRVAMTSNTVTSNCVLAHASYVSDVGNVQVGNPLFVDAATGNYTLMDGSPAIDVCATSPFIGGDTDYSEFPRGVDTPLVSNGPGLFDLGAFEKQALLIFGNDFE